MTQHPDNIETVHRARNSANTLATKLSTKLTERIVLAESCTAGMVAALLGQIPGISKWLCGSAVTYRESVKQNWLGVDSKILAQFSAESIEVTREMARSVLQKTDEATISAAITGHLGPDAPPEIDGKIFIAVAIRNSAEIEIPFSSSYLLESESRIDRQYESSSLVLDALLHALN